MKIGIITIHFPPNYGAVMQSYGLATYLRSTGADAEIVDYRQPEIERISKMRWGFPPPINLWMRLRRNASFVRNLQPLSPRQYHSLEEFLPDVGRYDALITGSDQVWFTGPVQNYDRMYFLDFPAPGRRKISYAASVGGTTDFGKYAPRIRSSLSDFSRISVRDAHSASLIAPLASVQPVEVVDPVLLCDFAELLDGQPPLREPYVLIFGNFSGSNEAAVRAIVAATGITRIVALQYPSVAATQRIPAPSPVQWLNWFRHASFVVTSYFHGTAFAAKFERPFISIPTPGRRIKCATMLDWMGLGERCFLADPDPSACVELVRKPIDWLAARERIARRVEASQQYLRDALR